MDDVIRASRVFAELEDDEAASLAGIAREQHLAGGGYLFLLGDAAEHLYIVAAGKVDLCLPLSFAGTIKDISLETVSPGEVMGWSALVKPYRYTMSARAVESARLVAFPRKDLMELFGTRSQMGYRFMRAVADMVGHRFLLVQALWIRQLQNAVSEELSGPAEE
ncbi:MAG: cyclic nucleotide-binding domain-containing protein [Planctomycetes bacterium]|nr:cyclic nucleotide-binding domain-containing protein [Planctomycetota bacterium]